LLFGKEAVNWDSLIGRNDIGTSESPRVLYPHVSFDKGAGIR
jgi:hypothetical protein